MSTCKIYPNLFIQPFRVQDDVFKLFSNIYHILELAEFVAHTVFQGPLSGHECTDECTCMNQNINDTKH
jgi:hypothetical protein